jgi:hypothetical protein
MGRAFLVRTTAGLQQPSKDRGNTEHGLRGKLMGYGIIVRTTAGSRELGKDRGLLEWVSINRNYRYHHSRTALQLSAQGRELQVCLRLLEKGKCTIIRNLLQRSSQL